MHFLRPRQVQVILPGQLGGNVGVDKNPGYAE